MSRRKSLCIFCQKHKSSTRDHIPPECLWAGKKAINMITVPCCTQCQSNQKGDDEYFRTFLSASLGSSETKSGQSALKKVSREHQIRRNRSPGANSYFQPQLKPVINQDGEFLGYLPQGTVDVKRMVIPM